ncbi:MAG: hydroxypyruvate isomerase family protein [Oscillospiraceae bacterium]
MEFSICTEAVFSGVRMPEALGALPNQEVSDEGATAVMSMPDKLELVKQAGFSAFEFWGWGDKDIAAIRAKKEALGLVLPTFCTKFTSLVDSSRHDDYLEGLRESVRVANELGCPTLITQCGDDTGEDRAVQRRNLVAGLVRCIPILEESGIDLLLEPLNGKIDHVGTYLQRSAEAYEIAEEVGSPRVRMLFDIYHQQITEGDVLRHIEACFDRISHIHVAGSASRSELYNGELDYGYIFRALDKMGYQGYVGLEYFPQDAPQKGLDYVKSLV